MRLALYQPDIAQNAASLLRLAACLGVAVDLIEPAGFIIGDARWRRVGMDYLDQVDLSRHASWEQYLVNRPPGRLVLLTTRGAVAHHRVSYHPDDTLLVGRESAGVPASVHQRADLGVRIPMRPGMRSLNVASAAALVLATALDQTGLWPEGVSM